MTDKRAKKILDFLAKKLNGSEFTIHKISQNSIASIFRYGGYDHLFKYSGYFAVSQCDGYAEILRKMLRFSSKGHDIDTLYSEIFLHKDTTLEKLLIEIDLSV